MHPAYRRRGLGAALFAEVLGQDAPDGARLQCNTQRSWTAGNSFLAQAGFEVSRTELLMRRAVTAPVAAIAPEAEAAPAPEAETAAAAEPEAPAGAQLRAATARDDDAWIALHAEAYGDRDDFSALTRDDLQAERDAPGFTLIVAEIAGEAVGYCHAAQLEPREAVINSLVVRADLRRRKLGQALMSAGLRALAARAFETASLSVVSDNRAAIAVYRRLGFATYDHMLTCQRPLRVAAG